jgi:hypothetical protein
VNEFYVGYLVQSPPGIRSRVRILVATIFVLSFAGAILFAASQKHFANSTFEFGKIKEFHGFLQQTPYPILISTDDPFGSVAAPTPYLLVAPGKHGTGSILQSLLGQPIRLKGTLISRTEGHMIEIVPDSPIVEARDIPTLSDVQDLGERDLSGEIVDTKCFLGVMNPGEGKVHRDCAALCLRGGIPPALFTRDLNGSPKILLLTDSSGGPLPQSAYLQRVGQPVRIHGRAVQSSGLYYLRSDADHIFALP